MDFKHYSPVPIVYGLKKFCMKRDKNPAAAKALQVLLLPISFNPDRFNALIKPLNEAAMTDPELEKSWCASTDRRKDSIIYPHIAAHPRCIALAARLSITPEFAARVVYKAAFPQMIDFMTVQKLAENRPLMNWLIENSEVTDGHFDRAHACLAETEAAPAAAAPAMGGAGGPAAAARLAEEEAACPADSDSSSDRCPFPSSFGDPIVDKLGGEVRRLGYAVEFRERELAAANERIADLEQKYEEAQIAAILAEEALRPEEYLRLRISDAEAEYKNVLDHLAEVEAAAAARLAEVEAAAQTRAAADAKRIAAAEAAQAAAVDRLAESESMAAHQIAVLEQKLSSALLMAQTILSAACLFIRTNCGWAPY